MNAKKVWWHGTCEKHARIILQSGFKKGTYFAAHLEDAISFGGDHVFTVWLDWPRRYWQIRSGSHFPASIIRNLDVYMVRPFDMESVASRVAGKDEVAVRLRNLATKKVPT